MTEQSSPTRACQSNYTVIKYFSETGCHPFFKFCFPNPFQLITGGTWIYLTRNHANFFLRFTNTSGSTNLVNVLYELRWVISSPRPYLAKLVGKNEPPYTNQKSRKTFPTIKSPRHGDKQPRRGIWIEVAIPSLMGQFRPSLCKYKIRFLFRP